MQHVLTIFTAFLVLSGLPRIAGAEAGQAQAREEAQAREAQAFLKSRQLAVTKLLAANKDGSKSAALSSHVDNLLDYEALSKNALSDHWDGRSPQDRQKFVALLRQLVERNYRENLRSTLGYRVDYLGTDSDALGIVVRTRAKSKKNRRAPAISIDYTLHQRDGSWRVLDITTDGVSMVRNYRSQFNRILRKDGWTELIQRMQKRLGDAEAASE